MRDSSLVALLKECLEQVPGVDHPNGPKVFVTFGTFFRARFSMRPHSSNNVSPHPHTMTSSVIDTAARKRQPAPWHLPIWPTPSVLVMPPNQHADRSNYGRSCSALGFGGLEALKLPIPRAALVADIEASAPDSRSERARIASIVSGITIAWLSTM